MRGKHSHHCAIPAPLIKFLHFNVEVILDLVIGKYLLLQEMTWKKIIRQDCKHGFILLYTMTLGCLLWLFDPLDQLLFGFVYLELLLDLLRHVLQLIKYFFFVAC